VVAHKTLDNDGEGGDDVRALQVRMEEVVINVGSN